MSCVAAISNIYLPHHQDVVRGKRDHLGVHNTGNVVLKTSQHGDGYIVVDGQQRITTTMLLLAALRQVSSGVLEWPELMLCQIVGMKSGLWT